MRGEMLSLHRSNLKPALEPKSFKTMFPNYKILHILWNQTESSKLKISPPAVSILPILIILPILSILPIFLILQIFLILPILLILSILYQCLILTRRAFFTQFFVLDFLLVIIIVLALFFLLQSVDPVVFTSFDILRIPALATLLVENLLPRTRC